MAQEQNGTATFNTPIYSSNPNNPRDIRVYVLDDVITKNFPGPYNYSFGTPEVIQGLRISVDRVTGKSVLLVEPGVETELSINVNAGNKVNPYFATATTMVTIDNTVSYYSELTKFLNNENITKNLDTVKTDWSSIINGQNGGGVV